MQGCQVLLLLSKRRQATPWPLCIRHAAARSVSCQTAACSRGQYQKMGPSLSIWSLIGGCGCSLPASPSASSHPHSWPFLMNPATPYHMLRTNQSFNNYENSTAPFWIMPRFATVRQMRVYLHVAGVAPGLLSTACKCSQLPASLPLVYTCTTPVPCPCSLYNPCAPAHRFAVPHAHVPCRRFTSM